MEERQDFRSPGKKQRKLEAPPLRAEDDASGPSPRGLEAGGEVVGNSDALAARPRPTEAVTDAARAFRQLRVRPARSGVEGGGPVGGEHGGGRARSPKKRKASVGIDKEFILQDDKVKRNTDQQGDISQARGMLGQLLFEFGQLELNKDLLEAIKRTESRTGRQSRGNGRRQELDRIAFENVVAEACELLHTQMATVAAHSEDAELQRAILRAYAVQAIATFADEDYSSDEEGAGEEGGGRAAEGGYSSGTDGSGRSPSPLRQQTQDMQHSTGSGSLGHPVAEGEGESEEEGEAVAGSDAAARSLRGRSTSVDMLRAGSATPGRQGAAQCALLPAGAGGNEPAVQQGSASEQVSSSILPDAPPESALEDTAAQRPQQAGVEQQQQAAAAVGGGLDPHAPRGQLAGGGFCHASDAAQLPPRPESAAGEAAASTPRAAQSSGLDDVMQQLSDAVDDMLRSPEAVTSRPRPPPVGWGKPLLSVPSSPDSGVEGERAVAGPAEVQQQTQQAQQQQQQAALFGGERINAPGGEPRRAQQGHPRQPAPAAGHPPHPRLHYHPHHPWQGHRQRRRTQQEPLPALVEEGSLREAGGEGGAGGAGRPPLRALSPQQLQAQQAQHSSGGSGSGSGGTQQSDVAQNEALKRQRTDDAATGDAALQLLVQAHSPPPAHHGALEATSPLLKPQQQPPGTPPAPLLELQPSPPGAAGREPPPVQQRLGLAAGDAAAAAAAQQARQQQQQQQQQGRQQPPAEGREQEPEGGEGASVDAQGVVRSGSSVWGSTLVCADLTLNDVASRYWPFLRSAMQGQGPSLREDDSALVAALVGALGEVIAGSYTAEAGGRRPPPEAKSLIAATAFDDMFKDKFAQESGASQ